MEIKLFGEKLGIEDFNEENSKVINKKKYAINCTIIIISLLIIFLFSGILLERRVGIISKAINMYQNRNYFDIKIADGNKYIEIGEEIDLDIITNLSQRKIDKVNWVTSDSDVVTIENGKVKGVGVGKAVIYGLSNDFKSNVLEFECLVKINDITLDNDKITVSAGKSQVINAKVFPEEATHKELMWSSSDEEIATVVNGEVFGKKCGICNIIISDITGSVVEECEVEVTYTPVESISLDDTSINLGVGNQYILNAIVYPSNATFSEVKWYSSDNNIAIVENGVVMAMNVGQASIIASTGDNKEATFIVNVVDTEPVYDIKYAKVGYNIKFEPNSEASNVTSLQRNDVLQILKFYDGWTKVRTADGKVGYILSNGYTNDKTYYITGVPYINQIKLGLPTGCEAVSATMVAKYYGYNVSVNTIINNTPTDERGIWKENVTLIKEVEEESVVNTTSEDGQTFSQNKNESKDPESIDEEEKKEIQKVEETKEVIYGGNPFEVFVGHPSKNYEQGSYGCFATPIEKALISSGVKCTNISNCSNEQLLEHIKDNKPVIVWGTYNGKDITTGVEWTYPDNSGKYLQLKGEHCMVLIGYDDYNVYLHDPIAGEGVYQSKDQFFKNWNILYRQAIVIN